ncbi:hypothetical protein K437DRAFT_88015 [Tilletiaria anomala UBC 951]|uniref:Uncharacterized protein n=1 Tax=Tilletiaria anomala (strain ATCC 24038 / CBS 436.72 / UBC 951) TaxID=1037660 RepID=A0A066W390_TILAU|nr:uncharacterized protein K437DRAFT_88015 [Tilletiaria anomala UBC 951]KDN48196.1 hypothetical protein K437DRAFT_88015 [Tilletiaria anomala UBC 951]
MEGRQSRAASARVAELGRSDRKTIPLRDALAAGERRGESSASAFASSKRNPFSKSLATQPVLSSPPTYASSRFAALTPNQGRVDKGKHRALPLGDDTGDGIEVDIDAGESPSSSWPALSDRIVPRQSGTGPDDAGTADFTLSVTQATMCQYVNITFDPSRGTGPFNVVVAFSNFFPYQFQIPDDYAPKHQGLWNYRFLVPDFGNSSTNVIVALTDKENLMSNSSSAQTVQPRTSARGECPDPRMPADFIFFPTGTPQQCKDYLVTWEGAWVPPMTMFILPENQPPISIPLPDNPLFKQQGSGSTNVTLPLRAGTSFFFTMTDTGKHVTGGVSQRNVVGLDENLVSNTCLGNAYNTNNGSSGVDDKVPRPTTTVPIAGATGLPYSYVTASTATLTRATKGDVTLVTFIATQTVVQGTPLPGWGSSKLPSDSANGSSGGRRLSKHLLGIIISLVIVAVVAAAAAQIVWSLCRKRTARRRRQAVTKWDVPSSKPADPTAPIHRGIFTGTCEYRGSFATLHSTHASSLADGNGAVNGNRNVTGNVSIDLGASATAAGLASSRGEVIAYGPLDRHGPQQRSRDDSEETELQDLSSPSSTPLARGASRHAARGAAAPPLLLAGNDGTDSWLHFFNASTGSGTGTGARASVGGGSASQQRSSAYAASDCGAFTSQDNAPTGSTSPRQTGKPGERAGPGTTYRFPYAYAPTGMGSPIWPSSPSAGAVGMYPSNSTTGLSATTRSPLLQNHAQSMGPSRSTSSSGGGGGSSGNGTRFVQHTDAGLLMDDNIDAEDAIVDLPPQYDTISNMPAARGDLRAQNQALLVQMPSGQPGGGASSPSGPVTSSDMAADRSAAAYSSGLVNPDLLAALESSGTIGSDLSSFARGRPLLEQLAGPEEDENEFWTSAPAR